MNNLYLPFGLPREFIGHYRYVLYTTITVCKELFYLFFVRTEMHILDKNTALIPIVFRVGCRRTFRLFLFLFIKGFTDDFA